MSKGARLGRASLFSLVLSALVAADPALAERGSQHDRGRQDERGASARQQEQRDAGAARAAAAAESRYGGKVLKVSPQGGNYSVRLLLPDGTVKNVVVDVVDAGD